MLENATESLISFASVNIVLWETFSPGCYSFICPLVFGTYLKTIFFVANHPCILSWIVKLSYFVRIWVKIIAVAVFRCARNLKRSTEELRKRTLYQCSPVKYSVMWPMCVHVKFLVSTVKKVKSNVKLNISVNFL